MLALELKLKPRRTGRKAIKPCINCVNIERISSWKRSRLSKVKKQSKVNGFTKQ